MTVIVLAHRVPYPPEKGEKIRTFHQIKYLIESGYEIKVLAPAESECDLAFQSRLESELKVPVTLIRLRIKWYRMLAAFLTGEAVSVRYFYTKELQRLFDEQCSKPETAAIYCTSSAMAKYVFTVSSSLKNRRSTGNMPKLVMDFMDLDSEKWQAYALRSRGLKAWVYRRESRLIGKLEQKIAETFDASLFVSKEEKSLLDRQKPHLSKKTYVVENGVDTSTYSYRPVSDRPRPLVLLFTGVMNYLPNEEAVIWFVENTWPSVRSRFAEARFVIAGMKPSAKVKSLERYDGVEVTGFVPDMTDYYLSAHVFIASFQMARGIQNKVLQAFASGVPVVASKMAAEGLMARDKEHLLIAHTPDEYLQAVSTLANDLECADAISCRARLLVEAHYSWQGKNLQLEALLGCNTTH